MQDSSTATRVVQHVMGETVIPVTPEKIVTLHDSTILDPVLSLGIRPIGAATYAPETDILFRGIPDEMTEKISQVGSAFEPSIEKILSLKPDLIIGREYQENIYPLLSEVAPTVLIDWEGFSSFQENLLYIADIIGRSEKAEQVLTRYQEKVERLKQRLEPKLQKIEVAVIGFTGQTIKSFSYNDAAFNHVLEDVGIKRIPKQRNQTERFLELSLETLVQYDADVIFIVNESDDISKSFLKTPLWSQLRAAKDHSIYAVDDEVWFSAGPIGINQILDDLFEYLADNS
ncbi:MAG: iron-siderophore ABC transporter substrate-binding protein [Cyanobacteria bacterium P01_H01_bin.21]